jgi:subtilisin-like proprotein convertase family protein
MGKKKLLAALLAALLVPTSIAAFGVPAASANAPGGGSDAVFTPSNPGPFNIVDVSTTSGTATPQNAAGLVTDVNIKLNDLGHTFPDDLDIELVGPTGVAVILMSDTCGSLDIEDIDLTFDDEAAGSLPDATQCASGTFKPTNFGAGDTFPTATTNLLLSVFDGTNPNGNWTLHMVDDLGGDVGDLEGGFQLTIVTAPFSILIPGTGSSGAASPYPFLIPVSGKIGKVADVNITFPGVTQQFMEDLDILLVAPNGAKAMVLSDRCSGAFVTNVNYTLDDEAPTPMPAGVACPAGTYQPTDAAVAPGPVADPMPAPAPAGPYPSALSTFDGGDPNGNWLLYITDDQGVGNGFIINDPTLTITTTDVTPPETTITKKPKTGFKRTSKIKFTSNEAGATFQCKVDSKKFKPCSSPLKLKNLKFGKHKFQVRAIDAAGNVDSSPARAKWIVLKRR